MPLPASPTGSPPRPRCSRRPRASRAGGRRRAPATALCAACRAALPWLRGPRCPRCALPAPCGPRCPMAGSALARAWAPVAFEGPARGVVHALKFRGALALADLMAAQMVATAPPACSRTGSCSCPVPTPAAPPPAARLRPRRAPGRARSSGRTGLAGRAVPARAGRRAAPGRRGARRRARADGRVRVEVCAARPGRASCSSTTCTRRARRSTPVPASCAPTARSEVIGARLRTGVEIGAVAGYLS